MASVDESALAYMRDKVDPVFVPLLNQLLVERPDVAPEDVLSCLVY